MAKWPGVLKKIKKTIFNTGENGWMDSLLLEGVRGQGRQASETG